MQEIYLLDFLFVLLKILFIYFQRKGEREGEKHQCVVTSHMPPAGDLARNPGMCPDWESNWKPCGSQASAQSTEPHQPGCCVHVYKMQCLLNNACCTCSMQDTYYMHFLQGTMTAVCAPCVTLWVGLGE